MQVIFLKCYFLRKMKVEFMVQMQFFWKWAYCSLVNLINQTTFHVSTSSNNHYLPFGLTSILKQWVGKINYLVHFSLFRVCIPVKLCVNWVSLGKKHILCGLKIHYYASSLKVTWICCLLNRTLVFSKVWAKAQCSIW